MKVLALSCSPRKGGNTDLLLDELLRGVKDNCCVVEKIRTAELNILPCSHCDYCSSRSSCSIEDDMAVLYPKLVQSDWLIFASPIYFMAHCAQAKLIIDRCQVFWAKRYIRKESIRPAGSPVRRGIFLSVGATHGSKVFAGAKITMKWFFDALEMEYWDDLLFEGLDDRGTVQSHPTALRDAYALGAKLAETAKRK